MRKMIMGALAIMMLLLVTSSVAIAEVSAKEKIKAKASPNDEINVIVTLKDMAATDTNIQKVQEKLNKKGGQIKVKVKGAEEWDKVYPEGFAATIQRKDWNSLLEDPNVARIDLDKVYTVDLESANYWSGATKARRPVASGGYGVDGDRSGGLHTYNKNDVVIAILDTGIDPKHKDLTGEDNGGTKKIIGWYDVINGLTTPYDDMVIPGFGGGHGTHVASIAAGEGDADPKYKGAAPGAALVGVKVLSGAGSGSSSGIIKGMNWVLTNKATYGIKIMSMSLGSPISSDGTDPEGVVVNRIVDAGIVAVIAAGNSGPKPYTIGSPGAAAKAITVGNIADPGYIGGTLPASLSDSGSEIGPMTQANLVDDGFYLTKSSSRGPTADGRIKPDVIAPGNTIMAAKSTYPNTATYHGGYGTLTGTSMATPFVSGVVALMLDANYSLTPTQIKNAVRATGEDYGVTGCDIDYGCGRLRAYKAVGWAKNGAIPVADQAVTKHLRYSAIIGDPLVSKAYPVTIADKRYPYANTLILLGWTGIDTTDARDSGMAVDFDLFALDPSNAAEGSSETTSRQETVVVYPNSVGAYKTGILRYIAPDFSYISGAGRYSLDISYK